MILISYTSLEPALYIEPFESLAYEHMDSSAPVYRINGRYVCRAEIENVERMLINAAVYRQHGISGEHPFPMLLILPTCPPPNKIGD